MGSTITNPLLDAAEDSVTPHVVPELPSWDVVLAPTDGPGTIALARCGRSGRVACARDGRRTCSLNCRGDECGGAACQACRSDGQANDDLD